MPDGPAAPALAEIRERHTLTVMPDLDPVFFGSLFQIKSHLVRTDVPRLLAAVEAALKLHQPHVRRQNWPPVCSYDNRRWPCPEVAAITTALTGAQPSEDGNHGR